MLNQLRNALTAYSNLKNSTPNEEVYELMSEFKVYYVNREQGVYQYALIDGEIFVKLSGWMNNGMREYIEAPYTFTDERVESTCKYDCTMLYPFIRDENNGDVWGFAAEVARLGWLDDFHNDLSDVYEYLLASTQTPSNFAPKFIPDPAVRIAETPVQVINTSTIETVKNECVPNTTKVKQILEIAEAIKKVKANFSDNPEICDCLVKELLTCV